VSQALDLAQQALEAAPAGDGTLVTVTVERSLLLRYARSRPTQATAIDDLSVDITVLRDGHVGGASTNETDAESLAACGRAAAAAAEAAARSAGSGDYPGLPVPQPVGAVDGYDGATAEIDPLPGGAALGVAFEVAESHGVEAHGIWTVGDVETALVSSTGVAASEAVTDAYMKVICIAPGGRSGYAAQTATAVSAIEPQALAERAAGKAAPAVEPVRLPPGEYPVVLEPHAVSELLSMLGSYAFNGLAYAEDRSALSGRLGQRVVAAGINLADSPRFPRTIQRGFDAEGVPKEPLPLIQDGVAHRVAHDTRSAAKVGAVSTGHAIAPGGSPFGAVPTNLVLTGGGARDAAELARPIERGIYVTRLWYVNPVRPKEMLLTGVTRDGTFLIEDGEIAGPIEDMRFTDSALGLLDRTEALTSMPVLTSDGEFYGRRFAHGVVCPALRASAMRFTG
jgi:PmbA protein